VSPRARVLWFGSAGVLVLAGVACAVFVSGLVGQVLTIALLLLGLGGALLLVFYEVGLSEDHERAREEERLRRRAEARRRPRPRFWSRRPGA
jgi:fatty acid desaturase